MYIETVNLFAQAAKAKVNFFKSSPLRYFLAALLAGAFVGFGIVLIFSIGAPFAAISSPAVKILMGVSFGIALTLVIIAGSELFTGLNMTMILGTMAKTTTIMDLIKIWVVSYIGNLLGSVGLAFLIAKAGLLNNPAFLKFITATASTKMHAPLSELFVKGILCNMLVCLAVWMSMRVKEDTAKMIAIFWCLFAFIACGYEHSIANMTLLSIPLMGPHDPMVISWGGFVRNLIPVSLGNIVGGGILIGAVYGFISLMPVKSVTTNKG
jgi:nitrite transporter NirC